MEVGVSMHYCYLISRQRQKEVFLRKGNLGLYICNNVSKPKPLKPIITHKKFCSTIKNVSLQLCNNL